MIGTESMSRINEIYLELNKIMYVSTTSFSVDYLEKSPSYFRTIRYGSSDVPIEVYVCLLENLDKELHEFKVREQCRVSKVLATKISALIERITKELIEDFVSNFRYSKCALGVFLSENETLNYEETSIQRYSQFNVPPMLF